MFLKRQTIAANTVIVDTFSLYLGQYI